MGTYKNAEFHKLELREPIPAKTILESPTSPTLPLQLLQRLEQDTGGIEHEINTINTREQHTALKRQSPKGGRIIRLKLDKNNEILDKSPDVKTVPLKRI